MERKEEKKEEEGGRFAEIASNSGERGRSSPYRRPIILLPSLGTFNLNNFFSGIQPLCLRQF